jgi:hypothetical protein
MKKLLLICSCLWLFVCQLDAQAKKPELMVVPK